MRVRIRVAQAQQAAGSNSGLQAMIGVAEMTHTEVLGTLHTGAQLLRTKDQRYVVRSEDPEKVARILDQLARGKMRLMRGQRVISIMP